MRGPLPSGFAAIRHNWGWFLALGIVLILLGVVAVSSEWIATLVSVLVFGWLLILAGAFEVCSAFWARQWSGFFFHLLTGALYVIVGLLMVNRPLAVAIRLTLLLLLLFVIGGVFHIVTALILRFPNWGWAAFDGLVSVILGLLIWRAWPSSALWVIGTFIGIGLIFRGWAWVMFALGARRFSRLADEMAQTAAA